MIFIRGSIIIGVLVTRWLGEIARYFRFVDRRTPYTRHSVFPGPVALALALVTVAFLVIVVYMVLDPVFLRWYLNGNADKDGIFSRTTDIGKSDWVLVLTGCVILFMSVWPFSQAPASQRVVWHHLFLKFYFMFTAVAFSGLTAIGLKAVFGRARPPLYENADVTWIASPFTDTYLYASFPSGHSTTVGTIAMVLLMVDRRFGYVFAPVALWVAASRAMVGAHFPSDIAAGLLLGTLFTLFYGRYFARKRLLFEFTDTGGLKLRNRAAKRARRKNRQSGQPVLPPAKVSGRRTGEPT